jgi:hypothetical protein
MALSLESIYKPLNDFFLNRFGTTPDSPVCFRFDKINSDLSDADCIDPQLPPPGYSPALAIERWSTFVNGIPVEEPDGISVMFTNNSIDALYGLRLLGAALPYLAPGTDEAARNAAIGSFSVLKENALKQWTQINRESLLTLGDDFKPSLASPENWYDKTNSTIWTSQTFQISEPTAAPPSGPRPDLWRLKIDDATLKTVAAQPDPPPTAPAFAFKRALLAADVHNVAAASAVHAAATPMLGHKSLLHAVGAVGVGVAAISQLHHGDGVAGVIAPAVATFALHDEVQRQFQTLNLPQRRILNQYIVTEAPTKPTTTPSVSITFEFCLIRITRPWFVDAFVNDRSWCLPGTTKGQLTAPDKFGATLPLLPIAAVAVRNLKISGNWTTDDVSTAAVATDFGPFKVDSGIVNNSLSHAGIQVVGWLLQHMPPLPPNDPS